MITALNELGYGVGQKAGQTLTVARTVPGDQVLVKVAKSAERWARADLVKVVRPGPDRVPSDCAAFERGCGGCQWLHLSYQAQVAWKGKNLANFLRTRADFRGRIDPIFAMSDPYSYRNKLSLKNVKGHWVFLTEVDGVALSPQGCRVQTPALQAAWAVLKTTRVPDFLEQLHLRSNAAGQIGLHAFVHEKAPGIERVLGAIAESLPGAVGAGATSRSGYRSLVGQSDLEQTVGKLTWRIPHNSFFQTNESMAPILLDLVQRNTRAGVQDRVLDLYCGAGFFGLALASTAREVIGIEENEQSVKAASENASANHVRNARFHSGDLAKVLATVPSAAHEIAILDPPREGLLRHAMEGLVARAPHRIVYVSCHPASLVRDLKTLTKAGWRGLSCTGVDMFPHTSHVEAVVVLERSSAAG